MLEMGRGKPNIARLPEATPPNALRVGPLDPCPRCLLLVELCRRLPLTGLLPRLIRLTCLEPYNAWLLFGPGALRPMRTRRAVLAGKAHLPCHPILGIGVWEPGNTLLAHWAGHDLVLPIHPKLRFVTAGGCASLPTGLIGHRADERNSLPPLALHQDLRVCIPVIHAGVGREQVAWLEGRLDPLNHRIIRWGRGCRLHIDH